MMKFILLFNFHFLFNHIFKGTLILHQFETTVVPIVDFNEKTNSYTKLKVIKPYIVLNKEIYISLSYHGLRNCIKIKLCTL